MIDYIGELRRIMNKSAAETFDPVTDSLEAIADALGIGPAVGLSMFGRCAPTMPASTTVLITDNLPNLEDDLFNDEFYVQVILNANAPGVAPEGEIRRITDFVAATQTFTTDAFSANVEANDLVLILHESLISIEIVGRGTLTASSTTVPADNVRTEANNYFRGCLLLPTEGACRFQPRVISEYTAAGGIFTLEEGNPFTALPGLVDYIIIRWGGTSFVPVVDSANNRTMADVTGNKADTASNALVATDSIMSYVKGILNATVGVSTIRITYYLDGTGGNDGNDGLTRQTAKQTWAGVLAVTGAGDRVIVAQGNYDEAITINNSGLHVICEPGVHLANSTPGTVIVISGAYVRWTGGVIDQAGQVGINIIGIDFYGEDIFANNCATGFQSGANRTHLIRCVAENTSMRGFEIVSAGGVYISCTVHGQAASRGYYLSANSADNNIFTYCHSLGCTAAGYETVAGADGNLFAFCSQSSLCAGPTDAGANNTWASHSEDSQITAGNTLQEDLGAIYTDLGTGLTGLGRALFSMDFWSDPQEEVQLTAAAGTKAMPDVTIADLPAGAVVERATAMFKFRMIENTNGAANKLNGATVASTSQVIQVRDDSPGTWRDAINFVDDQFGLAATTRESGDVCIGDIDIAVEVDGNDTYNFQWLLADADQNNLNFNDIQTGLRIWYAIL